ncbi:MAG: hypothetical protein BAA04_07260 [Firmicutes bacterium ZCTH02-B6]|nr:MAG: hypothetical protein BAA04_07260 [Firmicutes bacterium ZCTH02-B6]
MVRFRREQYERAFLTFARAVTVGIAYVTASPIPGLTSSFVAIFTSLLPFDLMVAATRPLVTWNEWKQMVAVLRPRLGSTAKTLLKGVVVGTACGLLALVGLPHFAGAVLTVGLSYVWALRTRYVISSYVAILSGLSVFERLAALDALHTVRIAAEVVYAIVYSGSGTFLGLAAGWVAGLAAGSVARLFLSRPYRSLQSAAYEPPMTKKPFDEVLHIGPSSLLVTAKVEEGSALAYRALWESRLSEDWKATVLSVRRGEEEVVMPRGSLVLLPGDELLVLADSSLAEGLRAQLQASADAGVPGGSRVSQTG